MNLTSLARATAAALGFAALGLAGPATQAQETAELIVAEPVHSIGYLPLYVAMHEGFFEEEGIDVTVMTVEGGGAHTNAVLSKQAFAFIGGPEHNAFAAAKGAELKAVVNVVNRGNVYFVAPAGEGPEEGQDLADFVAGKTIATGFYGSTPNSITRYMLSEWGLDPTGDVVLREMATAGIMAAVRTGNADVGVLSEPMLTQGIRAGFWEEPFLNIPDHLGPYAYSTLNIRQESIDEDPELVEGFVRAVSRGLEYTYSDPEAAAEIARLEFPTMPLEDLQATLERSFADDLWSADGTIAPEAWDTGKAVVMGADILKQDVPYEDIIDMQFIESLDLAQR